MKRIIARVTLLGCCFYVFIGFVATQGYAGEYYIYRDSKGVLVISNLRRWQERTSRDLSFILN